VAASAQKNLRLTFTTTLGSTFSLTFPQPKESITAAEVESVMDLIVSKNMFLLPGGELIGKRDIKIVDTTTNDLYDLPLY
jgi:hypothetical protein